MSFPTTHWSVLAAASLDGATSSRAMLERFCLRYRPPVLEFVRLSGHSMEDSEDVTQDFFLHLLESRSWKTADRARGRFRNFLLGTLKHHLIDSHRRRTAGKRGAGAVHAPLHELPDDSGEFSRYSVPGGAEASFDRQWAFVVVESALETVAGAMQVEGRGQRFERLAVFLQAGAPNPPYETLAPELGLTVSGLKTEIHRLRQRFRQALRTEVARTVTAPHEIDAEMAHLHSVLAAPDAERPKAA